MNPRNVMNVALDVLREALASKYLIVLFGLICLGLVSLALALDLEVVNGAIAAGKLFGGSIIGKAQSGQMSAEQFLGPVLVVLAFIVFWFGTLFLVVAVADIAPKMLAPGRVELLLSLPLRRSELVIGIYLGVLLIAALAMTLAIGGGSLVMFVKVEIFTLTPIMGAISALVGFATIYGVMLAVSTVARSAALSAGAGLFILLAGGVTSDRQFVLSLIRSGVTREIVAFFMGPLPRFRALAQIGEDVAAKTVVDWSVAAPVIGGCAAFGAFFLVGACIVVNLRDY